VAKLRSDVSEYDTEALERIFPGIETRKESEYNLCGRTRDMRKTVNGLLSEPVNRKPSDVCSRLGTLSSTQPKHWTLVGLLRAMNYSDSLQSEFCSLRRWQLGRVY